MNSDWKRIAGVAHLVVEALIAIGYVVAIFPFGYVWSSGWVIPLVLISFGLAVVLRNNTAVSTGCNIIMAFLSFIPLLGIVPRILGLLASLYNISQIRKYS